MQPLGLENEEAVPLYLPESFWDCGDSIRTSVRLHQHAASALSQKQRIFKSAQVIPIYIPALHARPELTGWLRGREQAWDRACCHG